MAAAPLTWEYESEYRARGTVCGCDEAGRGPLAGPVYAAAVILPDGAVIDGLNDSKKLSAKQREAVRGRILETALDSAVAFATWRKSKRSTFWARRCWRCAAPWKRCASGPRCC